MKYVVNATNTNLIYAYFMPIVCRMWKRLGYNPIAILLGNQSEWLAGKATSCVLNHIKCNTPDIIFLDHMAGLKDSTVAQVARLFCSGYPQLKEDDYLLTSDVDMLPLNQEYFLQQDVNRAFHIFGADAHGGDRFPICYLGACKSVWMEVMQIAAGDLQVILETHLDRSRDGWNYDELLFYEKITQSRYWNDQCQLINRGWPGGLAAKRLDRARWSLVLDHDFIDCHSLRPGYEHWENLYPVFKAFCPADVCEYFAEYQAEFSSPSRGA